MSAPSQRRLAVDSGPAEDRMMLGIPGRFAVVWQRSYP
jgi:hypothetical protein